MHVPKKQLTESLALGDAAPANGLAGWQATGLCVAAIATGVSRAGSAVCLERCSSPR